MASESIKLEIHSEATGNGIKATVDGLSQIQNAIRKAGAELVIFKKVFDEAINAFSPIKMIRDAIDAADEMGKLGQKVGETTEQMSRLIFATERMNIDTQALLVGFKRFSSIIGQTGQDTKNFTEHLLEQAEIFSKLEDGEGKALLAVQRFGRGGIALIPLLNQGRDGLQALIDRANYLGVVLRDQSAKANTFNNAVLELNTAIQSTVREGVMQFISGGIRMINTFTDLAVASRAYAVKFGALMHVIVGAWKDGKFPEMIGLLIEAGFEIGINAVKALWKELIDSISSFTSSKIGAAILNGVLTFGVKIAQALIDAFSLPITTLIAGLDYAADHAASAFMKAMSKVAPMLDKYFKLLGIPGKPSEIFSNTFTPKTWQESMDSASKKTAGFSVGATSSLEANLRATQAILGFDKIQLEVDGKKVTALGKINALVQEQLNTQNRLRAFDMLGSAFGDSTPKGQVERTADVLKKTISDLKDQLLSIEDQFNEIESSFAISTSEKYRQKKKLLDEQLVVLQKIVDAELKLNAIEGNQTGDDAAKKKIVGVKKTKSSLGPDPYSYKDQFTKVMTDIQNKWGSWAQQIAHSFQEVFEGSISAISDGISGLILGTKSWGQALKEIGTNIITTVVQSIAKMGTEFVVTHVIMRGAMMATAAISEAIGAKETAASIRAFIASSAAGAGKSGEQGGWVGVLIYMGVMAAALATLSAASGAFEKGGVVGGGRQMITVNENGTESVLNAKATKGLGGGMIDALNSGMIDAARLRSMISGPITNFGTNMALPQSARSSGGVSNSGGSGGRGAVTRSGNGAFAQQIHLMLVDSRNSQAFKHGMQSSAGEARVLEIVRKNKLSVGIT